MSTPNMTLKGKYVRFYVSKKGNDTFVYELSGTPEAIAAYKEAQGENLRHTDDDPSKPCLFFTTRVGATPVVEIVASRSGNYFIDNSKMKMAANLAAQNGGNLGQAIAAQYASTMDFGASTSSTPVDVPVDEKADLNNPK